MTPEAGLTEHLQEVLGMQLTDAERVAGTRSEVERFRLEFALRFLSRAASPFEVFFFMGALVAAKKENKCALIVKLFQDHASHEDRIEMAAGWAFSEPFQFGTARTPVRHVMHADCLGDTAWLTENGIDPKDLLGPLGC